MELQVKDFRYYKGNHQFSFSNNTTFILGESGAGKTSLLEALFFCLTGKGKNISCIESSENSPEVEMTFLNKKITRTRSNVFFSDEETKVSDQVAQAKIQKMFGASFLLYSQTNTHLFFELAPKDQLEVLEEVFLADEVDLRELKERFKEDKRALETSQKELHNKQKLTREFLEKIGEVQNVEKVEEIGDVVSVKKKFAFLKNRISLSKQFQEKVTEITLSMRELEYKKTKAFELSKKKTSFAREELEKHQRAMSRLEQIGWRRYLNYPVEECEQEISSYKEDREILEKASNKEVSCPCCKRKLWLRDLELFEAREIPPRVKEILEDHGAQTVDEALVEIEKQITLYSQYREKREQIDQLLRDTIPDLSLKEAKFELEKLERERHNRAQFDLLSELLEEKVSRLNSLRAFETLAIDWNKCSKEVEEMETFLRNAELFDIRQKEAQIKKEYEKKLEILSFDSRECSKKIEALARAQIILAETEQEYVGDLLDKVADDMNSYFTKVFKEHLNISMNIDSTASGQRKLRINFSFRGFSEYSYDMFSGGEKARLNLCFLLALANFKGNSILLLDEYSRFLDKETAVEMFRVIRENFQGCIVAAEHESIFESNEGDIQFINL